jgi:hypothetical protein
MLNNPKYNYSIKEIKEWLANISIIFSDQKWKDLLNAPDHLLLEELKGSISFEQAKKVLILI